MKICFASHNPNKVKEIAELVPDGIEIVGLSDIGFEEDIVEDGVTMEENSSIKAKHIHNRFNIPVFADDSGLEVDVLDGAPGVYSARYAGPEKDDLKNLLLLLKNLEGVSNRTAQFKTVITYIDENGIESQFTGTAKGRIGYEKKGTNGFGYDPIFTPEGHSKTFAEMEGQEKNALSHRAKAFDQLLSYLQDQK